MCKQNLYLYLAELELFENQFHTLQETYKRHIPNDEGENFVFAHLKAAAECILTKQGAKCRVPRESKVVNEKWNNMKKSLYLIKETQ